MKLHSVGLVDQNKWLNLLWLVECGVYIASFFHFSRVVPSHQGSLGTRLFGVYILRCNLLLSPTMYACKHLSNVHNNNIRLYCCVLHLHIFLCSHILCICSCCIADEQGSHYICGYTAWSTCPCPLLYMYGVSILCSNMTFSFLHTSVHSHRVAAPYTTYISQVKVSWLKCQPQVYYIPAGGS